MADVPRIVELYEEAIAFQRREGFPYWNALDLAVIEADIAAGAQYTLKLDGQIAGIFSFCPPSPMDEALWHGQRPHIARYINRIIVGRFWHGQALFAPMLTWCECEVRRLQLDCLRLDTWADNERLIAYYARFGFVALGERTASTGADLSPQYRGVRLVIMEKRLARSGDA